MKKFISWLGLVNVRDEITTLEHLKSIGEDSRSPLKATRIQKKVPGKQVQRGSSRIIAIEEVDDTDSEDEDLVAHEKPDDDPEDSDEDPTLINRSKPGPPVYIIDLVKMLRSDEPDRVSLGLQHAAPLIRRKAIFGSEVAENVDVLGASLINLQEGMDREEMHAQRLQALTACLVGQPGRMAPWTASMYFEGRTSISLSVRVC